MTVVVLTAVPVGLRGVLTRWLLEIAPGVFVGHVSGRVRDLLWARIVEEVGRGRAIMVHAERSEQRLAFRVHGHDWVPTDFDGLQLMLRPAVGPPSGADGQPRMWSYAERRLRGRNQGRGR